MDDGPVDDAKSIGWQVEARQFNEWRRKRKAASLDDFTAKFLSHDDKLRLDGQPVPDYEAEERQRFNDALKAVETALQFGGRQQPSITVNVPERAVNIQPAQVTVNHETKAADMPSITVDVNPTPVQVTNEVNPTPVSVNVDAPQVTIDNQVNFPSKATEVVKVTRDNRGLITGATTETDYEEA
jgi:hypothetical protein